MQCFEASPKQWGNSIGITIPQDIVKKEQISLKKKIRVMVVGKESSELKNIFGTLKMKKPVQEIMDEIDEGYDED